jgi:tyrosyl-tRNA synthetase
MSKSDPDSAIFMEDTPKDVIAKIKKAYCPPGVVDNNPCLDYVKYIIFGAYTSFTITRTLQNGGDK